MDWDKLRIFHAAAQAGSFTRAGEALRMSQSAVSRQVAALEANLGVPLFHRHARGLILTEQGDELYRAAADVLLKLETARSRLTDSAEQPSGTLRITATVGLGSTWLTQRLNEFVEVNPKVAVHLILDDEELDLAMREADVAIRLRQPTQPDLIQRRLFTVHMRLYAAPSYIARFGSPASIADLDHHRIVTFGTPVPAYLQDLNWLETAGRTADNPRAPTVKINNVFALKNAVARGIGIAVLPNYMVEPDSGLIQVLPDTPVPSFATYFTYPAELKNSARVRVFRDFILSKAQTWSY